MNNVSRWQKWAKDVAAATEALRKSNADLERVIDLEAPHWTAPDGTDASAGISPEGSLLIVLKRPLCAAVEIHLPESAALSLAQFIVNWYTPKPVSIL